MSALSLTFRRLLVPSTPRYFATSQRLFATKTTPSNVGITGRKNKTAPSSSVPKTKTSKYVGSNHFRMEMPTDPVRREKFIQALLQEAQMNPNSISPEISNILSQEGLMGKGTSSSNGAESSSSEFSMPQARAMNAVGRVLVSRKLHPQYSAVCKTTYPLTKQVRAVLKHINLSRFDIFVSLIMEKEMTKLNKSFRDVNAPTDVLSFPVEQPLAPGQPVEFGDVADLGELYICIPYCENQVKSRVDANPEINFTLEEEISVVLVHGMLHLAGYDHHISSAREQMQKETERVIELMVAEGVISPRCIELCKLFVLEDAPEEDPDNELPMDEETLYLHKMSVEFRHKEAFPEQLSEDDEEVESEVRDNNVDIDSSSDLETEQVSESLSHRKGNTNSMDSDWDDSDSEFDDGIGGDIAKHFKRATTESRKSFENAAMTKGVKNQSITTKEEVLTKKATNVKKDMMHETTTIKMTTPPKKQK